MQTATATATHPSSVKSIAFIEKNVLDTLIFPSFCSSCFCSDLFTLWVILIMWTLTDSVMLWFLYTIKKRIFRTAIWDSNRPQPLPSITLKYFIHVSYELLQLAAIMTFVQVQQAAALCLCSRNPRRVNYAAEETDLCLYSCYHPSCADTGHCPHTTHRVTSLFGQQQNRFHIKN